MDAEGASAPKEIVPRASTKQVPDGLLPELCKLLKASGPDGMNKVVDKFVVRHPLIARRQVELKIGDISVKEKRADDTKQIWHIKEEYQKYLTMENFSSDETTTIGQAFSTSSTGSASKRKRPEAQEEKDGEPGAIAASVERSTSVETPSSSKSKKSRSSASATPASSSAAADSGAGELSATKHEEHETPHSSGHPKKYKHAFAWFVKDKRVEIEETLPDRENTEHLKAVLKQTWDGLDDEARSVYLQREENDRLRYERELAAWGKGNGESSGKKARHD